MNLRPPRSTRTYPLVPYTTLFRSLVGRRGQPVAPDQVRETRRGDDRDDGEDRQGDHQLDQGEPPHGGWSGDCWAALQHGSPRILRPNLNGPPRRAPSVPDGRTVAGGGRHLSGIRPIAFHDDPANGRPWHAYDRSEEHK